MTAPGGGHQRIYRSLLRLYPADYRQAYGEQMVQLFGDQLRTDGTARTWLRSWTDLVTSAASEHLRRNRPLAHSLTLAPTPLTRVLGFLGVLGGASMLVAFVGIAISPDMFNLRLVLFNLGAIAVVTAVHQLQSSAGRRLALAGAVPAIVANVAYTVLIVRAVAQPGEIGPGDYQPVNLFIYVGASMWLSDAWFGLVTLRLGVLNRWSALALIVGSILALLGMSNFGLQQPGTLVETVILGGIAVHGLAWVLLGLDVALRRRAPKQTA